MDLEQAGFPVSADCPGVPLAFTLHDGIDEVELPAIAGSRPDLVNDVFRGELETLREAGVVGCRLRARSPLDLLFRHGRRASYRLFDGSARGRPRAVVTAVGAGDVSLEAEGSESQHQREVQGGCRKYSSRQSVPPANPHGAQRHAAPRGVLGTKVLKGVGGSPGKVGRSMHNENRPRKGLPHRAWVAVGERAQARRGRASRMNCRCDSCLPKT